MSNLTKARLVTSMFNPPTAAGDMRRIGPSGMIAGVGMGGGAFMTIIDPVSFAKGGPEWTMRYGDTESIRYSVASLLSSYDYLLSGEITQAEAVRRLRLLRASRTALAQSEDKL